MKQVDWLTKIGLVFLVAIGAALVTILILRARRVDRLFPPQELKVNLDEQRH